MEWLKQWMVGEPRLETSAALEQKSLVWNMIGSFIYAGSSMLLTAMVNHLVGLEQGGTFGFAFSAFGQQMFLVAYFGMRPYHSTDTGVRYTFGDYRKVRIFTCLSAILFGMGYILLSWKYFTEEKAAVVLLMVLYKVLDGFADVYESEFQRDGYLFLTGKAMAFRTILAVCCFLGVLVATRDLVVSCVAAVAAQGAGVLLFDVYSLRWVPGVSLEYTWKRCAGLVRECFLLFLSVFLDGFIFSMAKYAVDLQMTSTDTAIFTAIFLPTAVINLAANFVIRPFLTKLSCQWELRQFVDFRKSLLRLVFVIASLTVLALAGAWILGVPVLGAISNVDLRPYKLGLLYIILGGGFFALMNLFYYVLVIMKCQKGIFFGYFPILFVSAALAFMMVDAFGINGGAVSYLISMVLLTVCFLGEAVYGYAKEKRR